MDADEVAFLKDMLESAELLNCGEKTFHVHEQVVSTDNDVTKVHELAAPHARRLGTKEKVLTNRRHRR